MHGKSAAKSGKFSKISGTSVAYSPLWNKQIKGKSYTSPIRVKESRNKPFAAFSLREM